MIKRYLLSLWIVIALFIIAASACAQPDDDEGFGQTIQIYTRFHSFVGKPTWLLIVRDVDNNVNMPHMFDINHGDNTWVIFTGSRNYLITASRLQISSYRSCSNSFCNYRINDFCHLESNGHIMKGQSLYITIDGDLSPNRNSYTCHVSSYADTHFTIARPDTTE